MFGKKKNIEKTDLFQRTIDLENNYEDTFKKPAGIDILKDLREICHYEDECFSDDSRVEAFILGQRSVYIHILNRINKLASIEIKK